MGYCLCGSFGKILFMKALILAGLLLFFGSIAHTQEDTALVNRINEMLKITQKKDLEKIMDYTYPKLFDIAPRELMISTLQETYENDEFIIDLDSVSIITIFPIFNINDTSYVKIVHSMLMKMKYKEPLDTSDMESKSMLVSILEPKYGAGNVHFDSAANSLNIFMKPDMLGIKDKTSNTWTFITLNDDNPFLLEMLFSEAVRSKLKEYK